MLLPCCKTIWKLHYSILLGSSCEKMWHTISFSFFTAFLFIFRVNIFCLCNPIQIAFEIFFELLLLTQLLKISPSLGFFSFLGKFPIGFRQNIIEVLIYENCMSFCAKNSDASISSWQSYTNKETVQKYEQFPQITTVMQITRHATFLMHYTL